MVIVKTTLPLTCRYRYKERICSHFRLAGCQADISPCLVNCLFLKLCHTHPTSISTSLHSSSCFGIVISLKNTLGDVSHACLRSFSYYFLLLAGSFWWICCHVLFEKVLKLIVVGISPGQGQCQAWCCCQWSVVPGTATLLLWRTLAESTIACFHHHCYINAGSFAGKVMLAGFGLVLSFLFLASIAMPEKDSDGDWALALYSLWMQLISASTWPASGCALSPRERDHSAVLWLWKLQNPAGSNVLLSPLWAEQTWEAQYKLCCLVLCLLFWSAAETSRVLLPWKTEGGS